MRIQRKRFSKLNLAILIGYVIFMAWVVVWRLNYHPAVWISNQGYWQHPGISAQQNEKLLEDFK